MSVRLTDTHCHLTYDGLAERVPAVLAEARAAGVARMVTIGTSPADADAARRLAEAHDEVWFSAGLHPLHVGEGGPWSEETLGAALRPLLAHPRCVAVGETGLDRHHPDPAVEVQRPAFLWQLAMARETGLPVVIHSRKTTDEVLALLRDSSLPPERFVFHCFTGDAAEVARVLDFGAWVGFTGIVTYRNAPEVAEASDRVPLERLLVETDSPYLSPEPYRRERPNAPKHVRTVAEFLAARRSLALAEFAAATEENARRFYRFRTP